MTLRIRLLGPLHISRDGRPLELPGYRPAALLAYLLLTERPHSRQALSELLFEGSDDPRGALRWTLSQLRKGIGAQYIAADRREIGFNFAGAHWLDVPEFEEGQLELYRGELLQGLHLRDAAPFNAWLLGQRERLRAQYQAGLAARLEAQRLSGDAPGLEQTARELLALDNLREDWHRQLMRAYAEQGKFAAALAHYDHGRELLLQELGAEPAAETSALAAEIAAQQRDHRLRAGQVPDPGLPAPQVQPITQPGQSSAAARSRGLPRAAVIAALTAAVLLLLSLAALGRGRTGASLAGTTVTIAVPVGEEELDLLADALRPFEQRSGVAIEVGSFQGDFERVLPSLLDSGLAPDIVQVPQPGLAAEFVRKGQVVDVRSFMDEAELQRSYRPALLDAAMIEGVMAGVWYKNNIKSLVWYSPAAFAAGGYDIPRTWSELTALSAQMAAEGHQPWCIGIESGEATGWVGTDWVEDILLRTAPPGSYDAWVAGDLPFDSAEIRRVFDLMGAIWLDEEQVYGGREAILNESFVDSALHLLEDPPGCLLHKQASFLLELLPDEARYGRDYDFFYLPPIDAAYGRPVLGAGDLMVMFNDRPEVRAVMRYLTTAEAVRPFVQEGGVIAPQRDTPFEWYASPQQLKMAQILLEADTYRFDGSDAMPAVVGAGAFRQGIVDWAGGKALDAVLREIDGAWAEVDGQ